MALSKIQAESVNLSDDFAFTGTVTGAGLTSPFGNTVAVTSEGGAVTTNLAQGLAKVWVNFDGTASGAASRDSFNVSGMLDVNIGQYTVSYINSMSNGTYAFTTATVDSSTTGRGGNTLNLRDGSSPETGNIKLEARVGAKSSENGGLQDQDFMFVTVMGDLA